MNEQVHQKDLAGVGEDRGTQIVKCQSAKQRPHSRLHEMLHIHLYFYVSSIYFIQYLTTRNTNKISNSQYSAMTRCIENTHTFSQIPDVSACLSASESI